VRKRNQGNGNGKRKIQRIHGENFMRPAYRGITNKKKNPKPNKGVRYTAILQEHLYE
jgi:hypothetical protein